MSDVIERLKKRIKKECERLSIAITETDKFTKQGISDCIKELRDSSIEIIDEELAKEPQKCNSDLISRKKLIEEMNDTKHSLSCIIDIPPKASTQEIINIVLKAYRKLIFDTINNQPQVQQVQK